MLNSQASSKQIHLPFHVNSSLSSTHYKYHTSPLPPSSSANVIATTLIHQQIMGDTNFNMPPGFRFYPTDEELVVHFLHRKAALLPCHPDVIPDLDLYPYDPWDLEGKAMCEGSKWYFYSRRTQSRITESGYWQQVGIEEPIYSAGHRVGVKKYSAFFLGQISQGSKTNWIMQEYRLSDSNSSSRSSSRRRSSRSVDYSKWVICRVYERNCDSDDDDGTQLSCLDEVFLSLDDLDEISLPNYS